MSVRKISKISESPWWSLSMLASVTISLTLVSVFLLSTTENLTSLSLVSLFVAGVALVLGGGFLTFRISFEFFPLKKQIVGLCISGIMYAYMFVAILYVLRFTSDMLFPLVLILAFCLIPSIVASKILRHMRITFEQLVGLAGLLLAALFLFEEIRMNSSVGNDVIFVLVSIPVVAIITEIISRFFNTVVISPWVHSFWVGLMFILLPVVAVIFSSQSNLIDFYDLINLPIWIVFVVVLFSGGLLATRFLLQKMRMSNGYAAHKNTLLLLFIGILFASLSLFMEVSIERYLPSFALFVLSYNALENRLFEKIGLKEKRS